MSPRRSNNLASLYQTQGRYAEAEPLYKRALAIREKALGPDHPTVATSSNNLAHSYDAQGRYAEAEPLYKRALAIRRRRWARTIPLSPRASITLQCFTKPKAATPRPSRSTKRTLVIYESTLGSSHPYFATSLINLASLYKTQSRKSARWRSARRPSAQIIPMSPRASITSQCFMTPKAATPRPSRSISARWRSTRSALGPVIPMWLTILNNLASLYAAHRPLRARPSRFISARWRSARRRWAQIIPTWPRVLNNLASLYEIQSRYAQAEPLYKRALAIDEKAYGADHPEVATDLNRLASLYKNQSRYGEAEPLYKRALAIREKAYGAKHPEVAKGLNSLAALYDTQGNYAQAEPLYRRALAIREKALGPDHPDVAVNLNDFGGLRDGNGRPGPP